MDNVGNGKKRRKQTSACHCIIHYITSGFVGIAYIA
jgi:hypothetical protein